MRLVLIIALAAETDVLAFDSVNEASRTATISIDANAGQDEHDQLSMTLQTLLDSGEILGWGASDTTFKVEGSDDLHTLADMVKTNCSPDDGHDWITAELLAIPPGETRRVGMVDVTRPA